MGQITQILVVKTIHFKDGTKQHKNELYQSHWGHGRTMFMALMSALWKHSHIILLTIHLYPMRNWMME